MHSLRIHVLKAMAKSPAHAKWALDNPSPETPAMRLGKLAHALTLGTPTGPVWDGERRGKAWLEFKEANEGKDIVTASEHEAASEMAAHVAANEEAAEVLDGIRERTILFDLAGHRCRSTPDVYSGVLLTELKTTADASPERFPYQALKLGYHAQLAWQLDALRLTETADPVRFSVVAVENKPPYAVCVYGVTPDAIEYGRRLYRGWFEQFRVCEESDSWPGYGPGVLDAPSEAFSLIGSDGEVMEVD